MTPRIDVALDGPTETEWRGVCDGLAPFAPPEFDRLVAVSPHPDDETFGVGGMISMTVDRGVPVLVVAVSDGEAADPTDPGLAATRRRELAAALQRLDPGGRTITAAHPGLADGGLAAAVDDIAHSLAVLLRATDLVVCPLVDDGHPDHHAVAEASLRAARACGATARMFPVWAWHCHDPEDTIIRSGQRLDLSVGARKRKKAAIREYRSQTTGPAPVVSETMVRRLSRSFEVLVAPR